MTWLMIPFSHPKKIQESNGKFIDYLATRSTNATACYLAVGGTGPVLEILSIPQRKVVLQLRGFQGTIHALAQPSSMDREELTDLLLAACSDGMILLWHWPSATLLSSISLACTSFV